MFKEKRLVLADNHYSSIRDIVEDYKRNEGMNKLIYCGDGIKHLYELIADGTLKAKDIISVYGNMDSNPENEKFIVDDKNGMNVRHKPWGDSPYDYGTFSKKYKNKVISNRDLRILLFIHGHVHKHEITELKTIADFDTDTKTRILQLSPGSTHDGRGGFENSHMTINTDDDGNMYIDVLNMDKEVINSEFVPGIEHEIGSEEYNYEMKKIIEKLHENNLLGRYVDCFYESEGQDILQEFLKENNLVSFSRRLDAKIKRDDEIKLRREVEEKRIIEEEKKRIEEIRLNKIKKEENAKKEREEQRKKEKIYTYEEIIKMNPREIEKYVLVNSEQYTNLTLEEKKNIALYSDGVFLGGLEYKDISLEDISNSLNSNGFRENVLKENKTILAKVSKDDLEMLYSLGMSKDVIFETIAKSGNDDFEKLYELGVHKSYILESLIKSENVDKVVEFIELEAGKYFKTTEELFDCIERVGMENKLSNMEPLALALLLHFDYMDPESFEVVYFLEQSYTEEYKKMEIYTYIRDRNSVAKKEENMQSDMEMAEGNVRQDLYNIFTTCMNEIGYGILSSKRYRESIDEFKEFFDRVTTKVENDLKAIEGSYDDISCKPLSKFKIEDLESIFAEKGDQNNQIVSEYTEKDDIEYICSDELEVNVSITNQEMDYLKKLEEYNEYARELTYILSEKDEVEDIYQDYEEDAFNSKTGEVISIDDFIEPVDLEDWYEVYGIDYLKGIEEFNNQELPDPVEFIDKKEHELGVEIVTEEYIHNSEEVEEFNLSQSS